MGAIYRFAAKMFELTNWPRVIHILTSLPKLVAYLSDYSLEDILREKKTAQTRLATRVERNCHRRKGFYTLMTSC
jgi:hypothetical protein